jgi:hypothetical protein
MFERGPAFETKDGFRGRTLAAYPKEQSPLMSGYLLHPERIQGKAAAVEVQYGKGRIYLLGFRPQWRGQAHGAYPFFFNAIYESQGLSKPALAQTALPAAHRSRPRKANQCVTVNRGEWRASPLLGPGLAPAQHVSTECENHGWITKSAR